MNIVNTQRREPEWALAPGRVGRAPLGFQVPGLSSWKSLGAEEEWDSQVGVTGLSEWKCWEALSVPMTALYCATVGTQRGCSHIHTLLRVAVLVQT